MQLEPDYGEAFLLPPSIEDWISPDHPARFIREFVDSLDLLSLGLAERRNLDGGRSNYSHSMLLKLWLYAYFLRQRSSRKLEGACRDSMGAIWLAGRLTPDHNTLWRFWAANRPLIEQLFKQSVKVAARVGLVGLVVHALDGTKILAASSRRSALHRKDLEKALVRLDEAVAEISAQIQEAEHTERRRLSLELGDCRKRREAVSQALRELQPEFRNSPPDFAIFGG